MPVARRLRETAFSLGELLIVIAIIGILASLILTAVSRGKGKAQQLQCASNVRQLGLALQGFLGEHHAYPLVIKPSWVSELQHTELPQPKSTNHVNAAQYLSQGVWLCPSARRPADLEPKVGYVSYGYNSCGLSSRTDTESLGLGGHFVWHGERLPAPPVKESEVSAPSEMMAMGDGFTGGNGVVHDGSLSLWRTCDVEDRLESTKRSNARHRGKANVVFCDGHVESPTLKLLFEDTSDAALVRWNRDHQPHREKLKPQPCADPS